MLSEITRHIHSPSNRTFPVFHKICASSLGRPVLMLSAGNTDCVTRIFIDKVVRGVLDSPGVVHEKSACRSVCIGPRCSSDLCGAKSQQAGKGKNRRGDL